MKEDALGFFAVSPRGFLQLLDHGERIAGHGLTFSDVPDQFGAQVLDIFRRGFVFADNRFRRQLADLRGAVTMLDIVWHRQIRRADGRRGEIGRLVIASRGKFSKFLLDLALDIDHVKDRRPC